MMKFLEYLKVVKKRTEGTIKQYHSILREFQKFEPLTKNSWKRYLEHISMNKPKTQKNKLKVVKEYLNWKADNGLISSERFWNEAEAPREQNLPKAVDMEEIQKIISVCNDPYYKALFKLLANTGLRISEALNLKREDIALNGVAKIRVRGKGNKTRIINVSREIVEEAIKAGLFDKKVTPRAVQIALKKYAQKAGISQKVTPHIFRHSFAVALIEKGMPINKIQVILGHSNIATTGIYLRVAGDSIEIPQLI